MKYNMAKFRNGPTVNEENLTIYQLLDKWDSSGLIKSIGECCVDCSCTTIFGCIDNCGAFVIGENK